MRPRGRRPKPTAIKRLEGNRSKRPLNEDEPELPVGCPNCPPHLSAAAREEWERLAPPLYRIGVLTVADRAAFAAYCQAHGRWVEAEERLKALPAMVRTPNGHVQQNPWIGVANKQLELMNRCMTESRPDARRALAAGDPAGPRPRTGRPDGDRHRQPR